MIWIIIAAAICIMDQITKYLVINNIQVDKSKTVIDGFFYLSHIRNQGAALGMLQNGRVILITLTIIVSFIIIYYIFKSRSLFLKLSLSFILGGAVGNLIDRIKIGTVTDFLDFKLGPIKFWKYIFNVADIFVVVGTILLAVYLLFISNDKEKQV